METKVRLIHVFTIFATILFLSNAFLPTVEAGTTTFDGWFDIGCTWSAWGRTHGRWYAGDAYVKGFGTTKHIQAMKVYLKYRDKKDYLRIQLWEIKWWSVMEYGQPYPPTRLDTTLLLSLEINPDTDPALKNLAKDTPIWYQKTLDWDFTTKASYSEWKNGYAIWYYDYVYYIGVAIKDKWKKSWSIGYGPMDHPFYVDGGYTGQNVRTVSRWYSYDFGWEQSGWTIWDDKEFNIIAWA
ncbi:MAG: hypothetical protein OEZ25_05830 [Candidatus Bathyarchaeota archaeon]|nr:hypothetical protein [Candidatus Bathyarchaeota archaeon]